MTEFIGICIGGKADGYEMRSRAPFARFAAPASLPSVFGPCITTHDVPDEADDYYFLELRDRTGFSHTGARFGFWVHNTRGPEGASPTYVALAELARDARRFRGGRSKKTGG